MLLRLLLREKRLKERTTEVMTDAAVMTVVTETDAAETETSIVTLKEKEVTSNAASKES